MPANDLTRSGRLSVPPLTARFHALDALRGLAAVCIVLFHGLSPFDAAATWAPHAQLSVDLFFALSGFVLAANYEARLRRDLSGRNFMRLRAIRLFPLAWAGLAFGLAVSTLKSLAGAEGTSWIGMVRSLVLNAGLLPDLLPGEGGAWLLNVPLWSLSVELGLSLWFGFVLWRLSTRELMLIWMGGAVALGLWAAWHGGIHGGHDRSSWLAGPVRGWVSFTAGLCLWRAPSLWQEGRQPLTLSVLGLLLLVFLPGGSWNVWLEPLLVLLLVPATVCLGAAARHKPTPAGLAILGQLSFPLYALHYPVVQIGSALVRRWRLQDTSTLLAAVVLELLVSLVLAWLALRYIDAPLRQWLGRRS